MVMSMLIMIGAISTQSVNEGKRAPGRFNFNALALKSDLDLEYHHHYCQ